MAKDVKIIWDNDLAEGDIQFKNEDLVREEGLETSVFISLFTDRRADEDDELDNPDDKRGWWGDDLETNGDQIGSKLWLLDRAKTDQATINKAKDYIYESLEWMLTDGVIADLNVIVERVENVNGDRLYFKTELFKIDGTTEVIEYNDLWAAQFEGV